MTCRPNTTGRAATPVCALHSRLPFADAKKTGIVARAIPCRFDREMTALVLSARRRSSAKCVGISAARNSKAKCGRSPACKNSVCVTRVGSEDCEYGHRKNQARKRLHEDFACPADRVAVAVPSAALAEDFPSKPIRLIVPFPPGGPNDIIARVVGQRMSEHLQAAGHHRQSRRPGRRARHRCGREGRARRLHHRASPARARWRSARPWRRSPTTR